MAYTSLRLYPNEASAKKAGLELANIHGARLATTLYALLPSGDKKPTYLLSSSARLTVAEQRWVADHRATVTKLGRFPVGINFMPLQLKMVRSRLTTAPRS